MSIVLVLAPLSLLLGGFFVVLFFRSVNRGQFQDLETPAYRILLDSRKEKSDVDPE
jgi:cbb3-type cytochrome oxidase maturation protein